MPPRRDRQTVKDLLPGTVSLQHLSGGAGPDAIRELVNVLAIQGVFDIGREVSLRDQILEREGVASTAIGNGVAIPHCKSKFADSFGLAVGLSDAGIDFAARDEQPVRVVFLWICPPADTKAHLALMRALASLAQDPDAVDRVARCRDKKMLLKALGDVEVEPKGK
jgi:mannitol/fructose-specific phosphotransferase system IIA component (Ntr-type)